MTLRMITSFIDDEWRPASGAVVGGVKESGHGKEGRKYAIEEMTERRLTVWHGV
jgi:acyl-CoA reductase-like NAD-dependent aldehyde dehydrogenase